MKLGDHQLKICIKNFEELKVLGEKAFSQIKDKDYFWSFEEESNCLAIIIKHLSGNMISRWTDFLITDGEKDFRNRDSEFEISIPRNKKDIIDKWEKGWKCLFETINMLTGDDLLKEITIRNQKHTVVQAINRQLIHYGYHIGQIVYLAKLLAKTNWNTLSVARGRSKEFNERMSKKNK